MSIKQEGSDGQEPSPGFGPCSLCGTHQQHSAGGHSCCPCHSLHSTGLYQLTSGSTRPKPSANSDALLWVQLIPLGKQSIQGLPRRKSRLSESLEQARGPHPHHHHYRSPHFPSPSINSLQNSTRWWIRAYFALRFDPNANNVLQKVGLSIWDLHYCSCMTMELTTLRKAGQSPQETLTLTCILPPQ